MNAFPVPELRSAHVAVVGLGLMGGSLALALRPHVRRLTAVEIDEGARRMALDKRLVQEATASLEQGVRDADLVILATPVGAILQALKQLPRWRPQGCLLLDLGSTKGQICRAMEAMPAQFEAIGGHPMCGKESSGLEAAEETLYRNQTFLLCRTRRTTARLEHLTLAMLDVIGATPMFLEPEQHDHMVALVSHLPYFIAALLMKQVAPAAEGDETLWAVSASGFRDTSRLSGSEPRMIRDVVQTNRAAISQALRQYAAQVQGLLALLDSEDDDALCTWLEERQSEYIAYRRASRQRSS